ncbi:hypothetical protein [Novosphingobium sp. FKTRR1]|uniref:hypothetical protein n=1 Tax=Novosphingobium sp. FKTRR1 TaxID=2879118 RepID=UPI001CF03F79|nr:hypothetical protein [Novosphingobium sp. FKTRR1]
MKDDKLSPELQIWIDEASAIPSDALDSLRTRRAADGTIATKVTWNGQQFEYTPITMAEFYDLGPSNKPAD